MIDFKKYIKALRELYPNALVTRQNSETNEYTSEDINGNVVEVNANAIQNKITEIDNAYDAKQYQRDREKEYPSIVDQLDNIYHNGIDAWKATIKTTKDKYPK